MTLLRTIELQPGCVRLLDQRRLPEAVTILDCRDYRAVAEAIRTLAVRGAPAIGVAAAGALALAAAEAQAGGDFWSELEQAAAVLRQTRPTAVNLFWAIDKVMAYARTLQGQPPAAIAEALHAYAVRVAEEDVATNRRMAEYGQTLVPAGAGVLTHCNTGSLATVDWGTALGVLRAAHASGKNIHVYVDETRPVLQGARLTAWECVQYGIPATLITDNMAAHFMRLGKIKACFVGADRIAANGDTANKIGTYGVAVLAHHHDIPFYVVAPTSTVDLTIPDGSHIPIEERRRDEVTHIGGVRIAPAEIAVANPAFDVTPGNLIAGIVTERGIARPPYLANLRRTVEGGEEHA